MRTLAILGATALVTVAVASCAHARDQGKSSTGGPSQTTISSFDISEPGGTRRNAEPFEPDPPDHDDPNHPANRLATAACDRKLECGQVGEGRGFGTRQDCLSAGARQAHDALDRTKCDNGIDDARLTECIYSVRRGPCSTDAAMVGQFLECRSDRLCAK